MSDPGVSETVGPTAGSLLPFDPRVTILNLPNGLTCWIRPHSNPPSSLALGLHVAAGSLNEADDESGISHMLEHLAFSGGRHFPPGGVARFMDSLGVRLGRDYNAFTGMERTCFSFSLPDNSAATLRSGLTCLADFAHGLSLLPKSVDEERGVILEEMRQYHEARTRVHSRVLGLLLPGSPVVERHPLGSEEVVRSVTPQQLRSYYQRWYRPNNTTLLVVGDVDPEDVRRDVQRYFEAWKGPDTPSPNHPPLYQRSPRSEKTLAQTLTDPDVENAETRFVGLVAAQRPKTTASLGAWIAEENALWLINQRFGTLIREGTVPFQYAALSATRLIQDWDLIQAKAIGPADRWKDILKALSRELGRLDVHGFTAGEADLARDRLLADARRDLRNETHLRADQLLSQMNEAVPEGRPPISPAQKLEFLENLAPQLSTTDLNTAFARLRASLRLTVSIAPEGTDAALAPEEELLKLRRQAIAQPISPPPAHPRPPHFMSSRPDPGEIVHETSIPELGLLSLRLKNGVRVHLRPMDSSTHQIHVELTLAGGRIREHSDNFGLTAAAALAFAQPATENLSSSEIVNLLADKGIRFRSAVEEDAVKLRLQGDPADLEYGMQLIHLMLTRPHLEDTALQRWRTSFQQHQETSLEQRLSLETLRLLTGDDPRFRLMSAQQAKNITRQRAEEKLLELCHSPLEAAIVGDLSQIAAVELALTYLGSLPTRPDYDAGLDDLRQLTPKVGPLLSRVEAEEEMPRAAVLSGWRGAPWHARDDRRLLRIATLILNQRLFQEVRQERGLAYEAKCSYSPSKAYPQASLFSIAFYTAPERAEEAARVSREMVANLADQGPESDEIETARKQLTKLSQRAEKDPRYWSRTLGELRYRGLDPHHLTGSAERFQAYTGKNLVSTLKRYITEDRRLEVLCRPAEGESRRNDDAPSQF